MRTETIVSARNPKVKRLQDLQAKSHERLESGLFVVEGRRELGHCLRSGFKPVALFLCNEILPAGDRKELLALVGEANPDCMVLELPGYIYDKVAYRGGTEGIMAEVEVRERTLEDMSLGEKPLVMVIEGVEKPGNLGAMLRSADAAAVDAVIICDTPLYDLYNPNLIRASMGAVFSVPVVLAASAETVAWLRANRLQILAAQLQDSVLYYDADMTSGTAMVFGSEAEGLSELWRNAAVRHIRIPMLGAMDSLNVSVSAAILLFEAVRQRMGK